MSKAQGTAKATAKGQESRDGKGGLELGQPGGEVGGLQERLAHQDRVGAGGEEAADVGNIAAHRRRPRPRHPRHAAVPTFASYQVRNVTVTQPYAKPTAHATSSGTAMFV